MSYRIASTAVIVCGVVAVASSAMAEEARITSFGLDLEMIEFAPPSEKGGGKPKDDGGGGGDGGGTPTFPYYTWMHSDLPGVWDQGFTGAGQTITIIDDFDIENATRVQLDLDMDGVVETMPHGWAVNAFSQFVSPEAARVQLQYDASTAPDMLTAGLDVINLSFGLMTESGDYEDNWIVDGGHVLEAELIRLANIDTTLGVSEDTAVIVKAAGNGGLLGQGGEIGTRVGGNFGFVDVLGADLIGAPNVIFAGALDANGTIHRRRGGTGTLASYSDHPGDNLVTRQQYLVVGVDSSQMVAAGTSFAAPIISSYAAILGDKFTDETGGVPGASQVVDRLLETARTDTIRNYDPYYHGQGEASISRAVAPDWIVGN